MSGVERSDRNLRSHREPDPSGFEQADEDSNHEIEVLGGNIAGRLGKIDAAAAEVAIQSALLLHDLNGQRAMKDRNQDAQQQSCEFYCHFC